MTTRTIPSGSRVRLVGDDELEAFGTYECSACGEPLRGVQQVVAVRRRGIHSVNIAVYSIVHRTEDCMRVVT